MFNFLPELPYKSTSRGRRLLVWIRNSITTVADLRDWVLVIAGTFYFFGYLVWAINARRNNLGLLSALDFQYFVAGIFPVLTLVTIVGLVIAVEILRKRIIFTLNAEAIGWRRIARKGIFSLWWLTVGLLLVSVVVINTRLAGYRLFRWSSYIDLIGFLFFSLIAPEPSRLPPGVTVKAKLSYLRKSSFTEFFLRFEGFVGRQMARLFLVLFPIFGFIWLVIAAYPKLPQEFGGMKPGLACLDIETAKLSKATVNELTAPVQSNGSEPIVRTARVELLFSGADVIVVRYNNKIYKITKVAVNTVRSCG